MPKTEQQLTDDVVQRLADTPNDRLRLVMQALVRHLHAFAQEVRLTEAEWLAGIEFLTATGHITDDRRQEFILLSDTLGLSSLVEMITHGADAQTTESTILGPFYIPGAPLRERGASIEISDVGGEKTLVSGTVRTTAGAPISSAVLDVWQTAPNGLYDVQDPKQTAYNLRGRFRTAEDGSYLFATVRPADYPIPDDGPVGKLLSATGRHPWRAAHIHVKITADGYQPLTTHLFDAESKYLDTDTVFGVKDSLVRQFVRQEDGTLRLTADFVLQPA
jgi:protocatechuate 3,4-dioxygenase beta subunit